MAKGLRSYPEKQIAEVVSRRLRNKTGGLGYLAAVDYQNKKVKTA